MTRRPKTPRWLAAARAAGPERPAVDKPDWLSRALGRSGLMPLPQAEAAIAQGRVKVDGKLQTHPLAPLAPGARVSVDGQPIDLTPHTRVLMLHKPAGVVTAQVDQHRLGTVFEVLSRALPLELTNYQWHAVGRLDRDTTGLLLFTNDERFVEHATSPRSHLAKTYQAKVATTATEKQLQPLRDGLTLDDGPTRPAKARLLEPGLVELTLTEGRNRQVKRMLSAVGLPVLALHRSAVGTLLLDVPEGQLREVPPTELTLALGFLPRGADSQRPK